jgi:hypothetical protein
MTAMPYLIAGLIAVWDFTVAELFSRTFPLKLGIFAQIVRETLKLILAVFSQLV